MKKETVTLQIYCQLQTKYIALLEKQNQIKTHIESPVHVTDVERNAVKDLLEQGKFNQAEHLKKRLTKDAYNFVIAVQKVLTARPNINKTELLEKAGYKKTSKTARDLLDKYEGVHWISKKSSGAFSYRLL